MKPFFFFSVSLALLLFSCRKPPTTVPGGQVRILLSVTHHNVPIPNAIIYLKYDSLQYLGDTTSARYDVRYVADGNGKFTINGIQSGEHAFCFYAKGVDPNWDTTHVTKVFGYNYLITNTKIGENKDYPLVIPVSE